MPLTDATKIQVGDLVQVVRPAICCGNTSSLGVTYRVVSINSALSYRCVYCGSDGKIETIADKAHAYGCVVSRLKRIPPLDEPAETYTTETHKEPA